MAGLVILQEMVRHSPPEYSLQIRLAKASASASSASPRKSRRSSLNISRSSIQLGTSIGAAAAGSKLAPGGSRPQRARTWPSDASSRASPETQRSPCLKWAGQPEHLGTDHGTDVIDCGIAQAIDVARPRRARWRRKRLLDGAYNLPKTAEENRPGSCTLRFERDKILGKGSLPTASNVHEPPDDVRLDLRFAAGLEPECCGSAPAAAPGSRRGSPPVARSSDQADGRRGSWGTALAQ